MLFSKKPPTPTHQGKLILDVTVVEQATRYPTDLNLLNLAFIQVKSFLFFSFLLSFFLQLLSAFHFVLEQLTALLYSFNALAGSIAISAFSRKTFFNFSGS